MLNSRGWKSTSLRVFAWLVWGSSSHCAKPEHTQFPVDRGFFFPPGKINKTTRWIFAFHRSSVKGIQRCGVSSYILKLQNPTKSCRDVQWYISGHIPILFAFVYLALRSLFYGQGAKKACCFHKYIIYKKTLNRAHSKCFATSKANLDSDAKGSTSKEFFGVYKDLHE